MTAGETGSPWTDDEIELTVDAYLSMLARELRGERVRKVDVIRDLQELLPVRSVASIERKMQNISAVLDEDQHPWIDGYKPLSHYQRSLRSAVERRFGAQRRLSETLADYQASVLPAPPGTRPAIEDVLVPVPSVTARAGFRAIGLTTGPIGALQDYRNRRLGTAGEEWVVEVERESLTRAGRHDLASRVEWTAQEVGDGAGYDISSFRVDGTPRLIEVKTTNLGARTPFFVTRWEVAVSARRAAEYSLYRVFDFRSDPRLYRLDGSITESARLEPTVFAGVPLTAGPG